MNLTSCGLLVRKTDLKGGITCRGSGDKFVATKNYLRSECLNVVAYRRDGGVTGS